jgi:hypothetical protein
MDAIWYEIKSTNEQKVREKCENTMQNLFVKYLEKSLENRDYETAGGHEIYKRDVEKAKDEYFSILKDFKENEVYKYFDIVFLYFFNFFLFIGFTENDCCYRDSENGYHNSPRFRMHLYLNAQFIFSKDTCDKNRFSISKCKMHRCALLNR